MDINLENFEDEYETVEQTGEHLQYAGSESLRIEHRRESIDLTPVIQEIYESNLEIQTIEYYSLENTAIVVYSDEPPEGEESLTEKSLLALRVENGNDTIELSNEEVSGSNISVPSEEIAYARKHNYQLSRVQGFAEEGTQHSVHYTFEK